MDEENENNLADLVDGLQESQNEGDSGLEDGQVINKDGDVVTLDRN